ncbi:hypothetical protein AVEN_177764-1 [Araneus ventricosus]|uniref:Uncharacterized protein n=1 Tax=Araneus ventricosus TaxID=182803 RepID=A0A4Y2LIK5_ARAVE|nr:hypothetical protein AVEN_177764-1 [Araneus ventricosus]
MPISNSCDVCPPSTAGNDLGEGVRSQGRSPLCSPSSDKLLLTIWCSNLSGTMPKGSTLVMETFCDNPLPLLTTRFPKPFRQAFFAIWDCTKGDSIPEQIFIVQAGVFPGGTDIFGHLQPIQPHPSIDGRLLFFTGLLCSMSRSELSIA